MRLIIADIKETRYDYEALLHSFDEETIKRLNRFILDDDRRRTLIGLTLIRKYTPKGEVKFGEHGKPYKDGKIHFNVSHSGNLVGILLSEDSEVGLDIEYIDYKRKSGIDEFVFNEKLEPLEFYTRRTLKEAIGKCVGVGLGTNYKEVPYKEGKNTYLGYEVSAQGFQFDEYMIGIANIGDKKDFSLEILEEL